MNNRLTQKQENFCFNIAVKGMSQHDAYIHAGYSANQKSASIDRLACGLASNTKIISRIEERRNELEGPDILSRREYLVGLTRVFRTKITDFQSCGADGSSYIDIGPEHPYAGSVSEITSRTEYDKDGADAAVITKIKLHDPLQAGRDVAKVKGWLGQEIPISSQDNRVINIYIQGGEDAEARLKRLIAGEKPELTEGVDAPLNR